jgi:hypothetical protein
MTSNSRPIYVYLALLFIASFLLLNRPYGYVIAFQSETNDCFFLFGRTFFLAFIDHPGGVVRYAGRFLGQFYHLHWVGALIASAGITCFGVLFHGVLAKCKQTVPVWQTLLPCLLLLALHASTIYLLQDTLGLCVSCATFLGYLSLPGPASKRSYAAAITPIVYFCAGVYVWILVAWIIVWECLDCPRRSGLLFVASYAVFSMAIPLVAWRWLFLVPLRSALICPVMFGPPFRTGWAGQSIAYFVADCVLAVGLCGVLLLLPFWSRVISRTFLASFRLTISAGRRRVALVCTLAVLGVLLHLIRYDARLANIVSCRQLYKTRQWDALLKEARWNSYGDHRVQFMTNFALYHKGTLLDEMFRYPQPCGTRGLFMNYSGLRVATPEEDDTDDGMYNSDLLYEMGHVNFALRHAYNCISLQGRTYEALARMAECSIVNGNLAMAEKYVNLLDRTLFHKDLADHYRSMLGDPDAIQREFGAIREHLPTVDGFGHPTRHFLVLLESKPDNRMALEYLMAWLLLEKTPDSIESVCADMGHLRDAGHTTLPRHCQEAALMKAQMTGVPVDRRGFRFDRAIVTRAEKFHSDMSGQGGWLDAETARSRYGDTYMFYWFFETAPSDVAPIADSNERFSVTTREE